MSYLIIGQNRWGHAESLDAAKNNFRNQGGRLRAGYTVVDFGTELTFESVDQLGTVRWLGDGQPEITEIAPKT